MADLTIQDLIDTSNKKYWFVRTDGGEHFEAFYKNNFIGINWDLVTLNMLRTSPEYQIKDLIEKSYVVPEVTEKKLVLSPSKIQGKVTTILNKIKNFNALGKGDIIVIPSYNSVEFAFGIIQDDQAYEDFNRIDGCPYAKRRSVLWVKRRDFATLDAKFALIRKTIHAISEIDEKFYDVINNSMYESYIKNSFGNISIRIKLHEDEEVDYYLLKDFIDDLIDLSKYFEDGTSENPEIFIKLNLQSPGFVNLKKGGMALILALGLLNTACDGRSDENARNKTNDILIERNIPREKLDRTLEKGERLRALTNQHLVN